MYSSLQPANVLRQVIMVSITGISSISRPFTLVTTWPRAPLMAPVSAITFRAPPMIIRKPTMPLAPLTPRGTALNTSKKPAGCRAMKWKVLGSTTIRPLAASFTRSKAPAGIR